MTLEIRRQERDSSQTLVYRFTKAMQKSGVLLRKRESRYRRRPKSEQAKKVSALRRERAKRAYERLAKLGRLKKK